IENTDKPVEDIIKEFIRSFDLGKAPLFRVGVIRLAEDKYVLIVDMHHIISDGTSLGILIKEFASLYEGKELDSLRIQYKDYAEWQNTLLHSDLMKKREEYWLERFSVEVPILNIPTDYSRSLKQSFAGDHITFKLDQHLAKNLKRIASNTGSTLYMVLLSGINILLSKYSGQEDIIIGSPIAGRPHADLEKIIGMFVNTLAMRNYPHGNKTYEEFLRKVKENALNAYENQDYQFEELVDKLNLKRDLSRNPLFDVMFMLQNVDSGELGENNGELKIENLALKLYDYDQKTSKFDLSISACEDAGGEDIILNFEYSKMLFKRETIERMSLHLKNILDAVAADTKIKLCQINMLEDEEREKILSEFNHTYLDYVKDKMIQELFEEQVAKTPDKIAIIYKDQQLTYLELNKKANQLARMLRAKGVKADQLVGLMLNRSPEMIIGMFGVLKAGGAYVPIDPKYPLNRIQYILEDSGIDILLTETDLKGKIDFNGDIIDISDQDIYTNDNSLNLETISSINNLAYIIYTSGSTGKPKGVMVEQRNLMAYIHAFQQEFALNSDDIVLQQASFAFDASVEEIYPILTVGGRLVLPENEEIVDIRSLMKTITENQVTMVSCSPLMLNEFDKNEPLNSIHTFISGGDVLKGEHITELLKYAKVYNTYGPTESTVCATYFRCTTDKITNIPIGKPISNYQVYILDKYLNICPIGVLGELCVSGDGVTRGYLNQEELTVEKYIQSPFASENVNLGERIYRTGDLARWLPDGNIEFLGRIDQQVKIRGYRIELGEIESQLLSYSQIKETVVIDKEDKDGTKALCAYIVGEKEMSIKNLREHLRKNLPEYMIPSYFIQIEKLPYTSNGKIDRKALPELDGNITIGVSYEVPQNKSEEKLVQIWENVLAVDNLGIDHNFFEVGGHSLKATVLIAKIHKELNVQVSLSDIFKNPTIRELASYIANAERNMYTAIQLVEEMEFYPVSSSQKRIHIQWRLDEKSTAYNMPSAIILEGDLNKTKLEKAIQKLVERHEALRTSFKLVDGEPMQRIHDNVDIAIDYMETAEENLREFAGQFIKPFDISRAPLLRVALIKFGEMKHLLLFDMHHIISDGVSKTILTRDFANLYAENDLLPLRIQYKDFAFWHNSLLESERLQKLGEYWDKKLDNFAYTELPARNITFNGDSKGRRLFIELDEVLTEKINEFCVKHKITNFIFMLAIFKIIIMKMIDQDDISIGIPQAGRRHEELENIIGIFLNVLIIRSKIQNDGEFKEYLLSLKEDWLEAQENQDYPYEYLYAKAIEKWDFRENSLFSILFNYMPYQVEELILDGVTIKPYPFEEVEPKYSLTLYVQEGKDKISLNAVFINTLEEYKIENILESFNTVIESIMNKEEILISQIFLKGTDDLDEYLDDFDVEFDNQDFF
ncbi:MAG: amino acid adenylation domain-containing protein, partial [Halanaerobiales bacterium]|nr:amino acid adenylation domain-containing protein [Halanaerobiales bacterium]